jgi:ABC-type Fe3+/spermidine/putrescine transport system ATPase subunit
MESGTTAGPAEGAATAAPSASNETAAREDTLTADQAGKDSGLDLIALTKVFPGGTLAVDDVNLHVDHGEYVVLLGPSGCGKTTTLRMIGGHEYPTEGDILLDGQSLVNVSPHKRPTTTVFQHFALFPHKSVLENVEFGLKMHGVGKDERRRQGMDALEMVGLTELAARKPRALSGGQQQRVALARVLVTKPKALLLDEPLGDLDRLLQLRMRVELRNLQRQLGLMFIHVTHNQEEALSMADRIVVMNDARIQQVADPLTIATRPETEVVARFMGDNNIIRGRVTERSGDRLVVVGEHDVRSSVLAPGAEYAVGDDALVAVRAAAVEVAEDGAASAQENSAQAEIVFVEFLGDLVKLHLDVGGERMLAKVPGERYPLLHGREGDRIRITWKEEDVQLLRP